jgi:hypothetical protein
VTLKSGFDIVDFMGPTATKEDYEMLRDEVQLMLDDPENWDDEGKGVIED